MRVLVTGASRGIGRATATHLAAEGADAVAINYHESADAASDTAAAVEERGAETVTLQADVGDSGQAADLVTQAVDAFGGLDAVVNNAGVVSPARATDIDDVQWQSVLGVNLDGAFYVTRAALPHLEKSAGDVVFLSSIGGTAGTVDASYAASKAGIHGLTRALAREYGEDGVQVNAVAPGPVDTELNGDIVDYLERVDFRGHENLDTHLPEYACSPEEIAKTVAFLLDSEFTHGEIVNVNGGMQLR
ncbi:SDR family NAD(P)-dependent oxidoreductase [Halospeciosus flavus]|uniref:SDR family NAD(P)-dependent oxidoreductase n=1 Tax=Halospeciosus flavus TaxID=3032283 RepID=A0ABD5Z210_9EURY|nr:SDR family oxidoreductase [Halospeciosus flavus]